MIKSIKLREFLVK